MQSIDGQMRARRGESLRWLDMSRRQACEGKDAFRISPVSAVDEMKRQGVRNGSLRLMGNVRQEKSAVQAATPIRLVRPGGWWSES